MLTTLHGLRQQGQHRDGVSNKCLSDFVAPKETGIADHVGAFSVTAGLGIEERLKAFKDDHDDYSAIMLEALADRLAEAFAERLHEKVRRELWGYAPDEHLDMDELIREKYRGIRPAPGLPGLPRAHREGDAHGAPRRRGAHRHHAHRVDGDVAGRLGVAGGTSRTPTASTSSSAGSGATRSSRTPSARAGTCAPPSAGWARTSATSPRTDHSSAVCLRRPRATPPAAWGGLWSLAALNDDHEPPHPPTWGGLWSPAALSSDHWPPQPTPGVGCVPGSSRSSHERPNLGYPPED